MTSPVSWDIFQNMRSFLFNLKLRIKLLFAFGSLILLSAIIVGIFIFIQARKQTFQRAGEQINLGHIAMLEMNGALKYFILEGFKEEDFQKRGVSRHLQLASDRSNYIKAKFFSIDSTLDLEERSFNGLIKSLQNLQANAGHARDLLLKRGFKDSGLEGDLRSAIHTLENSPLHFDKVEMLMLRRHEKDFFLRKDLKYQADFNKRIEANLISLTASSSDENIQIAGHLRNYQSLFNEVVDIERKLGLTENAGLRNLLKSEMEVGDSELLKLKDFIELQRNQFETQANYALVWLVIMQLILGVMLAFTYSGIMTRAIRELRDAMQTLASGQFPSRLTVTTNEEIGQTKTALNQLVLRMETAASFSERLGAGNFEEAYPENFADDILAKSLIRLQQELQKARLEQNISNWTDKGLALLSDIIKNEHEQTEVLGDQILRFLIHYLTMNQGAIYLLRKAEEKEYLERISTYAYDKKKYITDRVDVGQGLAGQCLVEQEPIILTEVPKDYVRITSGLGDAPPSFVILQPLSIHRRAIGVIELASFERLETHKISLLQKVSESIASMFVNRQVHEETTRLLKEARARESRLVQSEEELRQNIEEMQAIQEQLNREANSNRVVGTVSYASSN